MPEGPATGRPGRSDAESMDVTEHGASMEGAMVERLEHDEKRGRGLLEDRA